VLKRWMRYDENLSDEGKRSGKGLIGFQVGNVKGLVDIVNCQVGIGDIPSFQVGKEEEVRSTESSRQGVLIGEEEAKEGPHSGEYSCGTASCVNEDDDKLETFITSKKDKRTVLIIGGVEIFLPSDRGEASIDVAYATKGQQT
jgi:hypothetical protein